MTSTMAGPSRAAPPAKQAGPAAPAKKTQPAAKPFVAPTQHEERSQIVIMVLMALAGDDCHGDL